MAVTDTKGAEKPAEPKKAPAAAPVSAPGWLMPLYLGGMVLVFIGERVLAGLEKGAGFVTGLGVVVVLVATLLRFSPRFRAGGERRSIESLLAVLSVGGLVSLALYAVSTSWGNEQFGIDGLEEGTKTRVNELLTVAFSALFVLSTLPMVFAETALRPMRHSTHPESRRVRAAASAGLTLAIAALYGALLVYAASGPKLDVDYSYFKTSRPSESTVKLAQNLPDPVRVVAFFPQVNEVKSEVERYLNELRPKAPKLQIEIRDRLLSPKLAKELRATQDGSIVLARGTTTQNVIVGTELKQAQAKLKTLDRDFQEQLTKLARARRTAYLSVGHGELNDSPRGKSDEIGARSASIVRTLLQRLNYLVKDIGLAQGLAKDVPDDADLVVVLGPTEPFAPEELAALDRYVKRNGKLFLALDADAFSTRDFVTGEAEAARPAASAPPPAPAASGSAAPAGSAAPPLPPPPSAGPLNDLAALVGLQYSTDVLTNERMHARVRNDETDRTRLVTQSFSSHASVSSLNRGGSRVAFVVFGAGSLEKSRTATQKMDFAVKAPSGTFPDRNRNYALDRDTEKVTTYNLAAAVTLTAEDAALAAANAAGKPPEKKDDKDKKDKKPEKTAPPEMRAFVVADADALSDFVLSAVVPNQMLFVDAVRWLVGEETFAGPPNTEEDKRIQHTKQQDLTWFYLTIFGIPSLVLAAGVFASKRSRREHGGKK